MSNKATTYVTLDAVTYEVEGTFFEAEKYNHETPAEPEHFEVARIFCDLTLQSDPDKTVTVDVTEMLSEATRESIDEHIADNLDAFTEYPDY